ncbi:MAG: MBL fold metallo-hydrolase, partial [Janthinobacterium lividum]|nr:MBL fold metallo-hydrolase [Janthinobacterium lividum]
DYLSSDPVRNAQNAVKVLLKFLLLERQRIAIATIPALLRGMPIFEEANRRFLRQETVALAEWAVAQLCRACAAHVEGEYLLNEPGHG